MSKDEALRMALEALEEISTLYMSLPKKGCMALAAIEEALAEQPAQQQECNRCGGTGDVSGEYPGIACPECNGSGIGSQPEFIKHEVENADDWSEWVCPDPKGYLMKCCDCGLVHEAQFKVVRYKSETEREDCEFVDDPNVQAVFRMRRSEQWSPDDMAYRPGSLPMAEQPAQQQEPVAWMWKDGTVTSDSDRADGTWAPLYTSPPPRKPWVGLTDEEQTQVAWACGAMSADWLEFAQAIEAKLKEKNA